MNLLHRDVELVVIVMALQFGLQFQRFSDDPLVQREQVGRGNRMPGGIEAVSIGQQKAQGIANTAIGIGGTFEDFIRNRHFTGIVGPLRPTDAGCPHQGY